MQTLPLAILMLGYFVKNLVDESVPTPAAIARYCMYLKEVYKNSPIAPENKWPPTPGKEFITCTLALVYGSCRDEYIGYTLQGNIKEVLKHRRSISIEQILELMEGAPGIGKSTLAWELCRKWDTFPCMKHYSLVVLLRLREKEVQSITSVSQLFCSYEARDKQLLVDEVSDSHGRGILFILDGFDELPKDLQKEGILVKLIAGTILPQSTILVTSRPSATADLLTNCSPRIKKRIETLGFTQESVEAYASSVFSSEPEKLRAFKTYISASKNPAINSLMYIPLNAAIIVEIYRSCKLDAVLPHTLTELYTQLCLTILTRYLKASHLPVSVNKFSDLPSNLYAEFLSLCQVAFEGKKKEEIIFHDTQVSDRIHFGFLDLVSSLYGTGKVLSPDASGVLCSLPHLPYGGKRTAHI